MIERKRHPAAWLWVVLFAGAVTIIPGCDALGLSAQPQSTPTRSGQAGAVVTPGTRPLPARSPTTAARVTKVSAPPAGMSVYRVTNANSGVLSIQHDFTDGKGFTYSFRSQVPPGAYEEYHLRDMPQIPSPFEGTVFLAADLPFAAEIAYYDR